MRRDQTVSAIEAARMLGIGLDYFYSLVWTGRIVGHKEGKRWRIPLSSVDARMKEVRGQGE